VGLLDRFRKLKRTCEDPLFGHLEADGHSRWSGRISFRPTGAEVAVVVATSGLEPSEEHRSNFVEFSERYLSLQPAISSALWQLFEPYVAEWDSPAELPTGPADMLRAANLESLELEGPRSFSLMYGLAEEIGWDDAMLCVSVRDWRVSPEALND
jgi:hypothetical protein